MELFVYLHRARVSYHPDKLLNLDSHKFDPYGGVSLGFGSASDHDNTGYSDYKSVSTATARSWIFLLADDTTLPQKPVAFGEAGYGVIALISGLMAKF